MTSPFWLFAGLLVALAPPSCSRYGFEPYWNLDAGSDHGSDGTDADGGADVDGRDDDGLPAAGFCPPLPPPAGAVIGVTPGQAAELPAIVAGASAGTTILLADGTYPIADHASRLFFLVDDVSLRSASGRRDSVVLDANYQGGIIQIQASRVTIADLTLAHSLSSNDEAAIYLTGAPGRDTSEALIYNVRVVDPRSASVVVRYADGTVSDDGTVACSHFEISDAARESMPDCGGVRGVVGNGLRGWTVRDNLFSGFFCGNSQSPGAGAIRFYGRSRDMIVERNTIVDCFYGIGLGLDAVPPVGLRQYADEPCSAPGLHDNLGGIIRNNFLFGSSRVTPVQDAAILLWNSCGSRVVHNTVLYLPGPERISSIEWRFATTEDVEVINNLVNVDMRSREGASVTLDGNITTQALDPVFADPASGDPHLLPGTGNPALDQGVSLPTGLCDTDIDGQARSDPPDVGADECLD